MYLDDKTQIFAFFPFKIVKFSISKVRPECKSDARKPGPGASCRDGRCFTWKIVIIKLIKLIMHVTAKHIQYTLFQLKCLHQLIFFNIQYFSTPHCPRIVFPQHCTNQFNQFSVFHQHAIIQSYFNLFQFFRKLEIGFQKHMIILKCQYFFKAANFSVEYLDLTKLFSSKILFFR